jgi:amyloid beta precursor protein binding protein 1
VHKFYQEHGVLPLPGSVPDMKAQSADYIELQNLYKSKARADVAWVAGQVRQIEVELKRVPIPDSEIELFCKNAAYMQHIKGKATGEWIGGHLGDAEIKNLGKFYA